MTDTKRKDRRVVVSFSTIPSRVPYLARAFEQILKQTVQPDRIYLCLPRYSKKEQCEYPPVNVPPRVRVLHCEDYGPITKLAPVLRVEKDPDTILLVMDDDMEYEANRFSQLIEYSKDAPYAALSGDGWIVGNWWNYYGYVRNPPTLTAVSIIQGCSVCLYYRKFFTKDILEYPKDPVIQRSAYINDDIWISGYLAKKGIVRLVHPGFVKKEHPVGRINAISTSGLHMLARANPVIQYFRSLGVFTEEQVSVVFVGAIQCILPLIILLSLILALIFCLW